MKVSAKVWRWVAVATLIIVGPLLAQPAAYAQSFDCKYMAGQIAGGFNGVKTALDQGVSGGTKVHGGLATNQWAAVVDRDGKVCAVYFSGTERGDQWPGSRLIAIQKAYTANAFSLHSLALSTANLWAATQPGGSLYGLQFSNPIDTAAAYKGPASAFGQGTTDPAVNSVVGGVNVFGGGLALYNQQGQVIGGLGTSGNTSCADHIISWIVRDTIKLDNVPGGVSPSNDDNIIFDVTGSHGNFQSKSGFGHPTCGFSERPIAEALPQTHPIGSQL